MKFVLSANTNSFWNLYTSQLICYFCCKTLRSSYFISLHQKRKKFSETIVSLENAQFVNFGTPPHYLGLWKVPKFAKKNCLATKQHTGVLGVLISVLVGVLVSWLALYGVFVTFGIGIYIFGIFLAKNRGFFVTNSELILKRAVSMLKSTPAGKKISPPPVVTVVGAKWQISLKCSS